MPNRTLESLKINYDKTGFNFIGAYAKGTGEIRAPTLFVGSNNYLNGSKHPFVSRATTRLYPL